MTRPPAESSSPQTVLKPATRVDKLRTKWKQRRTENYNERYLPSSPLHSEKAEHSAPWSLTNLQIFFSIVFKALPLSRVPIIGTGTFFRD